MRLAVCLLVVAAGLAAGCGTRASRGTGSSAARAVEDPWPAAVAALRKETAPAGINRVLGELTAAAGGEPRYAPDGLPPAAEGPLKDTRLTDDDLKALRPAAYAGLDGHHLAECLYLRDAARTLDLDGLPPAAQADRAFAWVCRQVVPTAWVGPNRSAGGGVTAFPPVPPSYVLRRGSGSGLERAYALIALGQQLGLDVALVGPPAAADQGWAADPAPRPGQPPRGPFWAVAVRAGGDLRLYDPWAGEPVPGPGGKGVLTLAQAVATPELVKAAGAEAVKASVPYLAVPLPALAPRLKRLETGLAADGGVRLFVDLPARLKGFADATKTAPRVWLPPNDPFAYPRVLAGFIPPADGGASPAPTLVSEYRASQLPPGLVRFAFAPGLLPDPSDPGDIGAPDAVQLLQLECVNRVGGQFLTDPTPRERVQRGQPDAVAGLVALRKEYQNGQERLRTDRDREARTAEWVKEARERGRKLAAARDRNPAALAEAEQGFQKFWADTRRVSAALVDLAVADTGAGEATYLLAVAKHEQAERAQGRLDRLAAEAKPRASDLDAARGRAADAWAEARGWWGRYAPYADAQDKAFPGRAAHARRLADRAAARAGG